MVKAQEKGKVAERDICKRLNQIDLEVRAARGLPAPERPTFQRNQNQSAVGGSDVVNPIGLGVEVKHHAAASVGAWWAQCVEAAKTDGTTPVLVYKISTERKGWHVVMRAKVEGISAVAEIPLAVLERIVEDRLNKHYDELIYKNEVV